MTSAFCFSAGDKSPSLLESRMRRTVSCASLPRLFSNVWTEIPEAYSSRRRSASWTSVWTRSSWRTYPPTNPITMTGGAEDEPARSGAGGSLELEVSDTNSNEQTKHKTRREKDICCTVCWETTPVQMKPTRLKLRKKRREENGTEGEAWLAPMI